MGLRRRVAALEQAMLLHMNELHPKQNDLMAKNIETWRWHLANQHDRTFDAWDEVFINAAEKAASAAFGDLDTKP